MVRRRCAFEKPDGRLCGAPPGRESGFCFWHDPGKAEDLAEAQRLGGIRRKRERTIAAAHEFRGLASIEDIRRLLEIAATDALSLDLSIAKVRAVIAAAAARLLETGELDERARRARARQRVGSDGRAHRRGPPRRMTSVAGRRVAKLEGALQPREAVLHWLAEAQSYPGFVEYFRSRVVGQPVEAAPISVITARVVAAVRAERKGQPREEVERAVRRAQGDAVFLVCLVVILNGHALEVARFKGVCAAAASFWMSALLGGPPGSPSSEADGRERGDAWRSWRQAVDLLSTDVRVETEARAALERRYLGGTRSSSPTPRQRGPGTSISLSGWSVSRRPSSRRGQQDDHPVASPSRRGPRPLPPGSPTTPG